MSISIETAARSSSRFDELINLSDMRRFDAWCRTLGVTRNQLVIAVENVGEDANAVRDFLKCRRIVAPVWAASPANQS